MTVGGRIQMLADTARTIEDNGYDVVGLSGVDGTGCLSSELSIDVSIIEKIPAPDGVDLQPSAARVQDDGSIVVELSAEIQEAAATEAVRQPKNEAYKDPNHLKEVYEEYETFKEMRDALGVDVTPKTVRNHMVKHGIHEIETATEEETVEGAEEADSPAVAEVVTDGAGFPEDLTLEKLKEILQTSRTLYEVQQSIGLERDEVHRILRSLNLLDLVYGRISTPTSEVSSQEIDKRIRSSQLFQDLSE